MYIRSLDVVLNEKDLKGIISGRAPTNGRVTDINAAFQNEHLVLTGHVQIVLSMPFTAVFELRHTPSDIIARLVNFQPVNAFKSRILRKMVEFIDFATSEDGDSIRIPLDSFMAHHGLASRLAIQDLTIANHSLTLKLQGHLTLS